MRFQIGVCMMGFISGCSFDCEDWTCYVSDAINRGPPSVEIVAPQEGEELEAAEEYDVLAWVADDETILSSLAITLYLDEMSLEGDFLPDDGGAIVGAFTADPGEHTLRVVAVDEGEQRTRQECSFAIIDVQKDIAISGGDSGDSAGSGE